MKNSKDIKCVRKTEKKKILNCDFYYNWHKAVSINNLLRKSHKLLMKISGGMFFTKLDF